MNLPKILCLPRGDQEAIPVHSKSNQPTYFSLAHLNLREFNPDEKLLLEFEIQEIDSIIDRLYEARGLKFKKDFGRLLGVYTGLYLEMDTADRDFAFEKVYIGSNILKYYLLEIEDKHGKELTTLSECVAINISYFFGCGRNGSHEFSRLNNIIFFQKFGSYLPEFYLCYVNYWIFREIKSMGMQDLLSLIFGNLLLDQDDKLIVDQKRIETILDKLISEHEENAVKLLKDKDLKILKQDNVAALFKKRADDILDSIANGGENKPKITTPEPFRPLDSPAKLQVHKDHIPTHEDSHIEASQMPSKTDIWNFEGYKGSIFSVLPDQPQPLAKDKQQLRPANIPSESLASPGSKQKVSEGPLGSEEQEFDSSASSFIESSRVDVHKRAKGSISSSFSLSPSVFPRGLSPQYFKPKDLGTQRTNGTKRNPVQTDGTERSDSSHSLSEYGSNAAGGRGKLFYVFAFLFGALILIGFSFIAYYLLLRNKKQTTDISA